MIKITARGRIDDRDSAFPQTAVFPDGEIFCSLSVGGGPKAEGGTELYRSVDGGLSWEWQGVILPPSSRPRSSNCLRISSSPCGGVLYAYGARFLSASDGGFGEKENEPVFMVSRDRGRTWSEPARVPMPVPGPFEISHGALALRSGRLLAPAATISSRKKLGEKVLAAVSDDGGASWDFCSEVFRDPEGKVGFFEHKFAEYAPGKLIAVSWTVTMPGVLDRRNSYTLSSDGGLSWAPFRATPFKGQTMTPVPVCGERLLVLYNKRYGKQGIYAAVVSFTPEKWTPLGETLVYDPGTSRPRPGTPGSGLAELDSFMFGFPTAVRLDNDEFLATYWSFENGSFGVSWARLKVSF